MATMYSRPHRLLLAAVAASSTTASHAQHPLILQRLTVWNAAAPQPASTTVQEQVVQAATVAQKRSGGCVPTSAVIDSVVPATSVRFIFQGILAGQLKNGWTVTARHPNCGATPARYTIAEDKAGAFTTIRTNQGRSLANESLIGDTWPLAVIQAAATAKRNGFECDPTRANLGVIRIAKEEPSLGADVFGVRYTGSWSEIWPVELCGRTVEVVVRFTADGDGGAYTDLQGTEAKLLPSATKTKADMSLAQRPHGG
ncbi:hypothetical protein ACFQPG_04725 [Sphingomonas sp. GCM10030256]|uniref:hypothetical protein n=1 Tax=Sphingomonas sp. GCM10030256 TaxID=3273427 RepID=UPI003607DE44